MGLLGAWRGRFTLACVGRWQTCHQTEILGEWTCVLQHLEKSSMRPVFVSSPPQEHKCSFLCASLIFEI